MRRKTSHHGFSSRLTHRVFCDVVAVASIVGLLCLGVRVSRAADGTVAAGRTQPVDIGSRLELFVDDVLIDRQDNTQRKLHEPVSGGVAIRSDRPWEGPANFGMSVIDAGDRLLMYYRGWPMADAVDQNGVGCVAESRDGGATWTKPVLNLITRPEWPDNNIIASDAGEPRFAFPCAPWVDARPGVPVSERIKMVQSEPLSGAKHTAMTDPRGGKRLVFWVSADGFSFRKSDPQPVLESHLSNCFDGGNTMFWSEAEGQYVLYYRCSDNIGTVRRTVARTTSKDFLRWSDPVVMSYGDSPREQLYVNNTQPYFRGQHIYVSLAARFMQNRRVLTDEQVRAVGFLSPQGHEYFGDCSDGVLLTSRAGTTQYDRAFMEALVRPGLGYENWGSRANVPLTGLYPCGPDRMMFWVSRQYMQKGWCIERMVLRTDGFASVHAPWQGGEMRTKSLTFTGNRLELNYATSAAGGIKVEVQDADGKPIPGYVLDDCLEVVGDEIARTVAWKNGRDLSSLAGKPIRLRFVMHDADLYAIRFR